MQATIPNFEEFHAKYLAHLTAKQQAWFHEYLIDFNAAAAARRAGYSEKTAKQIGTENLSKPALKAAISAALTQRAQANAVTAQRVLDELAALAFSNVTDLVELTADGIRFRPAIAVGEPAQRAVASIKVRRTLGNDDNPAAETVEFKLWDKVAALRTLALHLGLLNRDDGQAGDRDPYDDLTDAELDAEVRRLEKLRASAASEGSQAGQGGS